MITNIELLRLPSELNLFIMRKWSLVMLLALKSILYLKCTHNIWGGTSKKPEFICKKLCIYSYTCKLQYSPFHAIHLSRCFFHCSIQFLNLSILTPFSASAILCFTSSTWPKRFPLRTFFIRETKKSLRVRLCEYLRRGGIRVMPFLVKNC